MVAPGSTLYNWGQSGVVETRQELGLRTSEDEVILSSKDVGFYAERRFVEWYGQYLGDAVALAASVESEDVRYAASNLPVSEEVREYLDTRFVLDSIIGGYELLGPRVGQ